MKPIIPKTNIRSNVKSNAKINVKSKPLKKSSRLNELRQTFRRTAKKELFGEVSYYERLFTLYRLSNKPPNEKIMDLAKRILDVYNGKGTNYDVLHINELKREFERESGISFWDFYTFLRNTKAPKTFGAYNREIVKLDRYALQYAEVLKEFERLVENVKLKDNKIIVENIKINPKNRELTERFLELLERENARATKWLRAYDYLNTSPNVVSSGVIHGAVIFFVDAKKISKYFDTSIPDNTAGIYSFENHNTPPIILIDVNPSNRKSLSAESSLKHELRHNLFDKFRKLMISDKQISIYSASYNITSPELYEMMLSKKYIDFVDLDKKIYEPTLNRKFGYEDKMNIFLQKEYLSELHSNFMDKKENWFKYNHEIYAAFYDRGLHHELVGNNPKDINATKDMFCHLQGFYKLDKIAKDSKDFRFRKRIPEFYTRAGAILGNSLTVQQASRLIAQLWDNLLREFPNANKKINSIFSDMPLREKGRPSNGQTLEQFLVREYDFTKVLKNIFGSR